MASHDTDPPPAETADTDDLVVYLIVRQSLGLSAGKIGAQCGHAVQYLFDRPPACEELLQTWLSDGCSRKVVLRADEKEWARIKKELRHVLVVDHGHTEVAPMTETVIGLWPMRRSETPRLVRRLQAL